MEESSDQVQLRVRMSHQRWMHLKERALRRQLGATHYADMLFRYMLHDRSLLGLVQPPDPEDEFIYFELTVPSATKVQLAVSSEQEKTSLATFSGAVLEIFIRRFEKDPRDLAMIHFLSRRLDACPVLSQRDLRQSIQLCELNTGVKLPPGYLAKWVHGRVVQLLRIVEIDGKPIEVTAELIAQLFAEANLNA